MCFRFFWYCSIDDELSDFVLSLKYSVQSTIKINSCVLGNFVIRGLESGETGFSFFRYFPINNGTSDFVLWLKCSVQSTLESNL